ncbi:hypothetical protein RCL_jg4489.t1 [Rhizophagus clarus]|uniref:Integrase catalytic domain-containing protein n=1 Tax=Rhizophagus clarus TaxID=94130 RepID=A0A8H3KSN2_9GLOM|nr:hypothetical protein RCL_jg4489.t1 [Rhizophagus clarus]
MIDVASRYKASIPIGTYSVKDRQGILTSATIARSLEKIYDDPECPLVWPKLLITDRGSEFKGDCEKLMKEHDVKIQKAKSKHTMGIVERYNRTLVEKLFPSQDASDLLILDRRSRAWVKNLPIVVEDINNSITRQLGISPVDAIKEKEVFAKSSYLRDGPIGFDEEKLFSDVLVKYLLYSIDLEDGRRHAVKHPERSFVREELMIIPLDTELPSQ